MLLTKIFINTKTRELAASVRMAGIPTVAILAWRQHCSPCLVLWVPECPLKLNVIPRKWLLLQLLETKCLVNIKVILLVTISYTWLTMPVAHVCLGAHVCLSVCACALTNVWAWRYCLHIWKGHMIMLTLPLFSDKQTHSGRLITHENVARGRCIQCA